MTKHLVQRAFEAIGEFEIRGYSGRAMYGAECLGVEFDGRLGHVLSELVRYAAGLERDDAQELADALRDMRTDSMGRGTIAYFPDVHFTPFRCDFDECDGPAEHERGSMTYCATHAAEHDALVAAAGPDYAAMTDAELEQLGDHGRTEAIQAAANAELLRRDAK